MYVARHELGVYKKELILVLYVGSLRQVHPSLTPLQESRGFSFLIVDLFCTLIQSLLVVQNLSSTQNLKPLLSKQNMELDLPFCVQPRLILCPVTGLQ